jgi:hypothetical protein
MVNLLPAGSMEAETWANARLKDMPPTMKLVDSFRGRDPEPEGFPTLPLSFRLARSGSGFAQLTRRDAELCLQDKADGLLRDAMLFRDRLERGPSECRSMHRLVAI